MEKMGLDECKLTPKGQGPVGEDRLEGTSGGPNNGRTGRDLVGKVVRHGKLRAHVLITINKLKRDRPTVEIKRGLTTTSKQLAPGSSRARPHKANNRVSFIY